MNPTYIGDGVYASREEDGSIKLWTERYDPSDGSSITHYIYMDQYVLESLNKFIEMTKPS